MFSNTESNVNGISRYQNDSILEDFLAPAHFSEVSFFFTRPINIISEINTGASNDEKSTPRLEVDK